MTEPVFYLDKILEASTAELPPYLDWAGGPTAVEAGAPPVVLTPADLHAAATLEPAAISQNHALAPAELSAAAALDTAVISQAHIFSPSSLHASPSLDAASLGAPPIQVETLYPNSAGGAAWKGLHSDYPGTALADFQDTAYSSGEKDTVSTDDDNSVSVEEIDNYPGHRVQYVTAQDRTKVTQLDFTTKGTCGDAEYTIQLYVWNFTTGAWVLLDADAGAAKLTLTGSVTSGLTDYIKAADNSIEILLVSTYHQIGLAHYFSVLEVTYFTWAVLNPADLRSDSALDAASISQDHLLSPAELSAAAALDATTVSQVHVLSPAELHASATLGVAALTIELSPAGLHAAASLDPASIAQGHVLALAELAAGSALDAAVISQGHVLNPSSLHAAASLSCAALGGGLTVLTPADLHAAASLDAASMTQEHVFGPADLDAAGELDSPALYLEVRLYLSLPDPDVRRLTWEEDGVVYVIVDGHVEGQSDLGYLDLSASIEVRGVLIAYQELFEPLPSPLDRARLAWSESEGAAGYRVYRKLSAGAYALLADVLGLEYDDEPLPDGVYTYKVVAYDEEGDTADSNEAAVTISSAPEPPTGLAYAWDAETKTLTLSWGASPSADVATYRVRSSAGEDWLDPGGAPVQDSAALSYEQVFTNETGTFIFSVRAVDSDGIQEANIEQMLALAFEDGALAMSPAEPSMVYAEATPDGKIEVGWLYRPWKEVNGPGAAYEARIYWDAGTGTVDFDEPHATVPMGGPTAETSYEWESAVLTNDVEYRFVVRIATAAWPAGIETQNTGEVYATADSDAPAAPTLQAQLI